MIRLKTEEGTIAVDNAVYTNIAGYAATNCFGVKGHGRPLDDRRTCPSARARRPWARACASRSTRDNSIAIDLHIMVDKGVNISAICSSIIQEVRYFVTKSTGTEVGPSTSLSTPLPLIKPRAIVRHHGGVSF